MNIFWLLSSPLIDLFHSLFIYLYRELYVVSIIRDPIEPSLCSLPKGLSFVSYRSDAVGI